MKRAKRWLSACLVAAFLLTGMSMMPQQIQAETQIGSVQRQFIDSISGSAVTIARAHGLFPSVMIAQAILESDWGRSGLARAPYYNLFGIKGGADGVVFDTLEDDGTGNYYGIKDSFRRYGSYLESLQDYALLFRSTPFLTRVYANFVNASTVEEACQALTGTYATDTRYGAKLMSIIIGYNLLQFDGSVNRSPSWAITPKDDYVYSAYDEVNIREDHNTDSKILGRAKTGQRFHRLGVTTGWTLVQLETGTKAYIASEFLTTEAVVSDGVSDTPSSVDEILKDPTHSQTAGTQPKPSVTVKVDPTAPKPTEPKNSQEGEPSPEQVEAARRQADQAIAEGPSSANKQGLLDTRTAGVKNENPVDKQVLEGFLGSNVDLPFASEEVKQTYRETLQRAVSLYWSTKAKQEEIDAVVKELTELRQQAEDEDAAGLKEDNEKIRELHSAGHDKAVVLRYNKLAIESEPHLEAKMTHYPNLSPILLQKLRARGQRWFAYDLKLESEEGEALLAKETIELQLPIPEEFNPKDVELYVLDTKDESLKPARAKLQGDRLILHTKQVKNYVLVERNIRLQQARKDRTVYAQNPGALVVVEKPAVETRVFPELLIVLLLGILGLGVNEFVRWRRRQTR